MPYKDIEKKRLYDKERNKKNALIIKERNRKYRLKYRDIIKKKRDDNKGLIKEKRDKNKEKYKEKYSGKYYIRKTNLRIKRGPQKTYEEYLKSKRDYYKENSIKHKARAAVTNSIRSGKIVKLPCIDCGEINSQGHHPDYSKPLEVIWLCRKHHMELHMKEKML